MKVNVKGTIIPNDDQWIYDLFDIDATSPAKVSKGITAAAEKGEPLEIYINSGGGDIFAASEIYSAIREYSGDVKIHVVGLAAGPGEGTAYKAAHVLALVLLGLF